MESHSTRYRRDKVALRTTYIQNVKFKVIKVRTCCQYVGYLYHSETLNWPHAARGLDTAALGV